MIFLLNQNMIWRGSEGGNVKYYDAFEVSHESTLITEYKLQYKYMWNNKLPYTLAWPALYQYKCHALSVQYKCHPLCIHKHGTNTTFKENIHSLDLGRKWNSPSQTREVWNASTQHITAHYESYYPGLRLVISIIFRLGLDRVPGIPWRLGWQSLYITIHFRSAVGFFFF